MPQKELLKKAFLEPKLINFKMLFLCSYLTFSLENEHELQHPLKFMNKHYSRISLQYFHRSVSTLVKNFVLKVLLVIFPVCFDSFNMHVKCFSSVSESTSILHTAKCVVGVKYLIANVFPS